MGHLKEDCIKAPVDGAEKRPKVWGFGAMVEKNAERLERRREMLDPNEKGPESYAKVKI